MPVDSAGTKATLLIVCTGNLCRSPFAERLGAAWLAEALGPDAASVRLTSAGTRGVVGAAMHPFSALVLAGMGGDAAGFTARRLERPHVDQADLVLTMTREHRRSALELAPRALTRTFTLLEAADLLRGVDPASAAASGPDFQEQVRALVRNLAAGRAGRSSGPADDVPDPIGRPVEVHQAVGELIAEGLLPLLRALASLRPANPVAAEAAGLPT